MSLLFIPFSLSPLSRLVLVVVVVVVVVAVVVNVVVVVACSFVHPADQLRSSTPPLPLTVFLPPTAPCVSFRHPLSPAVRSFSDPLNPFQPFRSARRRFF